MNHKQIHDEEGRQRHSQTEKDGGRMNERTNDRTDE